MRIAAFNFETAEPTDVSGLRGLLESGRVRAADVLCVLGKTEGNGGRNDFTREMAVRALEQLIAPYLKIAPEEVQERIPLSFSGGTEGVVTPHMVVFVRKGQPGTERYTKKRLCAGVGHTRVFRPEEIGRMAQIEETARAVRAVLAGLQLDGPEDVHLVQLKVAIPPFPVEDADAAARAGMPLRCDMAYSRAASALGAALAIGEVRQEALSDEVVCRDYSLFSTVASCSAKQGLVRTEILAFGNSPYWDGDLVIDHGVLADILDVAGIRSVAAKVGLRFGDTPDPEQVSRIVGVFAKAEADPRGRIRGRRHTMLGDDDIVDTRYSRCVLSSVLAAVLGETRVYVSARAEHHGPLGGGPLAILARVED